MYDLLIRPIVRRLNINTASVLAKRYFKLISILPGAHFINRLIHGNRPMGLQKEVFGLQFYNPVGLGAGLDTRGDIYYELENLGVSFMEIGPLDVSSAKHAISQIQKHPQNDILMACISADFLLSFSLAYDFCDAFVIDIGNNSVEDVIEPIVDYRLSSEIYKPIIVKIPEYLDAGNLEQLVDYCRITGVDGIETRSIAQTSFVNDICLGRYPIIANCHIKTPGEAYSVLEAGASLIEIRSGIVTEGPRLVKKILKYISSYPKYVTNS